MGKTNSSEGTVVILGGGLAGLSALYSLNQAGYGKCELFEKELRVGGLTRSEQVNGFTFDFTGHLLHFRDEGVRKLVSDLLGDNLHFVKRNSWVFSKDRYTRYPFQTNLYGLPPEVVKECIMGFVLARNNQNKSFTEISSSVNEGENFSEWINRTMGKGISRHFMTPYNEKLWTVPLEKLTCEWMGRFIPSTSLEQILDGALQDHSDQVGYNALFGYPLKGGIESLPRAFANGLRNLHVNYEVSRLDPVRRLLKFRNGESMKYDRLVSSIPLPILIQSIQNLPTAVAQACSALRHVSVFNLNLGIGRNPSDKHWIYFPEPAYCYYRVGFSHNFSPFQAPAGNGSIYVEVAYSKWKPLDRNSLIERIKQDLMKARILRKDDEILAEFSLDIPFAYVLFDQDYRKSVDLIRSYAEEHGIITIGRYGSWEYSGMEDAIRQGKLAAEEILNG